MHNDAQDLVNISDAAERLAALGDKVERSTLSRYVANHAAALAPVRRGRETLVDFARLREHRGQNIRLLEVPVVTPAARTKSDSQARKVDAEARLRELELARETDKVLLADEVTDGAHGAVAAMRAAFDLAINDTAELIGQRLAVEPRLVRPYLRQLAIKAQTAFAEAMDGMAPRGIAGTSGLPDIGAPAELSANLPKVDHLAAAIGDEARP
jgi:hypothetical protein